MKRMFIIFGIVVIILFGIFWKTGFFQKLSGEVSEPKEWVNNSSKSIDRETEVSNDKNAEFTTYFDEEVNLKISYPETYNLDIDTKARFGYWDNDEKTLIESEINQIVLTNPEFPKKFYDCCYSDEEVEGYGNKPAIVIKKYPVPSGLPVNYDDKGVSLVNKLGSAGLSTEKAYQTLFFMKTSLVQETVQEDVPVSTLDCDSNEVKSLGNRIAVVSSGHCVDIVNHDPGATFVVFAPVNGYVISVSDESNEYGKTGIFDTILNSMMFE